MTITANDIAIVATVGPDRGLFRVIVNGVPGPVVDLYAPTIGYRRVVWSGHLGAVAKRDLRVVVLGDHDRRSTGSMVELDAIAAIR